MKALKILNNNIVATIIDGKDALVVGSGIGFRKKANETIDESKIDRIYYLQDKQQSELFKLIDKVSVECFEVCETIIHDARNRGLKIRPQVLLPIVDHIGFAIQRYKQNIVLPNLMSTDVRLLYPVAYECGTNALLSIEKALNIRLPDDEATYIALHLVNYLEGGGHAYETVRLVNGCMNIIEKTFKIELKEDQLSTMRIRTHLNFLASRIFSNSNETISDTNNQEMYVLLLKRHKLNEKCIKEIEEFIKTSFKHKMSDQEKLYLLIHLNQLIVNQQ
ncbi:MAG: PRD domain-containing protein [Erysipelotrichaceae bacterium]|nr:PRD domain-containing protein [Erysipelotrichaceae bacterium]